MSTEYLPSINVPAIQADVNAAQICRTCVHDNNRAWRFSPTERIKLTINGAKKSDLECNVRVDIRTNKILNKTDFKNRVVPLEYQTKTPIAALVDSCGQTLRSDCRSCDRFQSVDTYVAYTDSRSTVKFRENDKGKREPYAQDGSPIKYWRVSVGGHCSIPADGIIVNGELKHCDYVQKGKKVETPSCANCFYLDRHGENWQHDYLTVNRNAALSPFEREVALLMNPDMQPGAAIGLKLWQKQTEGSGRHIWYGAKILECYTRLEDRVVRYKVQFIERLVGGIFSSDDDRYIIHHTDNPWIVAVEMLWPYNKPFKLNQRFYRRPLVWPELPDRIRIDYKEAELYKSDCDQCIPDRSWTDSEGTVHDRPARPCYFHSKLPVRNTETRDFEFHFPDGNDVEYYLPLSGHLVVNQVEDGSYKAVDWNGNLPQTYSQEVANASVFRLWLPILLRQAAKLGGDAAVTQIKAQYGEITRLLHRASRNIKVRPSWYVNSTDEPSKAYCSHPYGLDLRKMFQDSFGLERVDWDYDHGAANTDTVEEEIRVGYRQHRLTPQALQEEIIATDMAHPRYDPASDSIPSLGDMDLDSSWNVYQLDAIGGMTDEHDNPVTSTKEFMDRLDDMALVGEHGQSPRYISKRMQLFGYDISRGYFGSRAGSDKTQMPSNDPSFVIFERSEEPDQADITDSWYCPECGTEYDQSQLEDPWYPVCDVDGSDLYKNHNTRTTYSPRTKGGVGTALVMDTPNMLANRRLYESLCPEWRLKASTRITLEDLSGSHQGTPVYVRRKSAEIHQVYPLTDWHKKQNAIYNDSLAKVIEQRQLHKIQNPQVTIEELETLFPSPEGIVYQEKAVGSAAKV